MGKKRAFSFSCSTIQEIDSNLQYLRDHFFHPTLAIAFSSPEFPFVDAIDLFAQQKIALIGCTTSGEIFNQDIVHDTFSFVCFDIDPHHFRIEHILHDGVDAFDAGAALSKITLGTFSKPGIVMFISGVQVIGDSPVQGIRENIEWEIPIFGGLAGDNLQHKATYSFTHKGRSESGVAALILDLDHLHLESFAVSGWKALGKTHTITKAEKNIIYEIDHQPALDLFLNYFGNIKYQLSDGKSLFSIPGQYPLKIFGDDGSESLRSLLIYDTDRRALMAAGKMTEGVRFKFCPPPDFSVVDQTIKTFETFSQTSSELDALLMVSCKGRHTSFGPMLDEEVESIHQIWDVPMAGFLSNGEIGSTAPNGVCMFHNVTCSLLGIKIK